MSSVRLTSPGIALALFAAPWIAYAQTVPPTPTHYVTDTQSALSATTRTTLDTELRAYERATGHQVIVWIGDTTGDTPLEEWTVQAAHQWKIGRAGKDDGAILFLFMKDHKVRIEVGYGLEGSLTDATSQKIIDSTIRPKMRAGDTDGAVQQGTEQMLLAITPGFRAALKNPPPAPSRGDTIRPIDLVVIISTLVFPLILMGLLVALVIGVNRRGRKLAVSGGSGSWVSSSSSSSGDDSSSSGGSDDDFDAGGGDFGGGGASGSW